MNEFWKGEEEEEERISIVVCHCVSSGGLSQSTIPLLELPFLSNPTKRNTQSLAAFVLLACGFSWPALVKLRVE
jgi:hypothetical protein